jgi:hypothetical protein
MNTNVLELMGLMGLMDLLKFVVKLVRIHDQMLGSLTSAERS